jgi:hypothetical protein
MRITCGTAMPTLYRAVRPAPSIRRPRPSHPPYAKVAELAVFHPGEQRAEFITDLDQGGGLDGRPGAGGEFALRLCRHPDVLETAARSSGRVPSLA